MTTGYLEFTLIQKAPLFIPGNEDGQWISLPFIPARVLNSALVKSGVLPVPPEGVILTLLNAYPSQEGGRYLPMPLSLREADMEPEIENEDVGETEFSFFDLSAYYKAVYTSGVEALTLDLQNSMEGNKFLKKLYFRVNKSQGDEFMDLTAPMFQVTNDLNSDLTPMVCLASGNRFVGMIQITGPDQGAVEATASELQQVKAELFLGIRRNAGFGGRLQLVWGELQDQEGSFFSDYEIQDEIKKGQVLRLIFTSRTAGNKRLDELAQDAVGQDFKVIGAFFDPVNERGLDGAHHLWREGTVVVLIAEKDMKSEVLVNLGQTGIGMFTDLGYGRFAVLKKAEEGEDFAYLKNNLTVPVSSMDSGLASLHSKIVEGMVDQVADMYVKHLISDGFSGAYPSKRDIIQLYGCVRNKGLEGLKTCVDAMDLAAREVLSKLEFKASGIKVMDLLNGLLSKKSQLSKMLDLDALIVRKSPGSGNRLSGKQKQELMAHAADKVSVGILYGLMLAVVG